MFKEGDIVFCSYGHGSDVTSWLQIIKNTDKCTISGQIFINDYAGVYIGNKPRLEDWVWFNSYSDAAETIRLATPEEIEYFKDMLQQNSSREAQGVLAMFFDNTNPKPESDKKHQYVVILDYCIGAVNLIELSDEEIAESEKYEDFEEFLSTLEDKYDFRLSDCNWMTTDHLDIYKYQNGNENGTRIENIWTQK